MFFHSYALQGKIELPHIMFLFSEKCKLPNLPTWAEEDLELLQILVKEYVLIEHQLLLWHKGIRRKGMMGLILVQNTIHVISYSQISEHFST